MKRLLLFIVLLTTILVVKAQDVTWTPEKPHVGEVVHFTFHVDKIYDANKISWYFEDDQTGNTTGYECTHIFTTSGTEFLVAVKVDGTLFYASSHLEVLPSNSIEEPVEITYKKEYQIYDVTGNFIGNNIKVLKMVSILLDKRLMINILLRK